ncbi:hypothetical protein C8F04DRAFT_1304569 [Mycena alexandri]|uniref:CCHC-type domain-containing protein n=1 Tax=Mycena alexandri TaxID=1745969 RepID=A0AAD6SAK0_9AGAR|nr:hypothetical protein C8F04DRAFT_1304569 [Mycena alexandri]
MVDLRSGNVYNPPATDDGPPGNLEMDARSGTSSSSDEMDAQGTSAAEMDAPGTSGDNSGTSTAFPLSRITPSRIERSHESFSGIVDEPRSSSSAAEFEHRSRLADVDEKPRPSPAAVAEHPSRSRTADVDDKSPAVSRGAASLSHHSQATVGATVDGGAVLDDSYQAPHDGFQTPKRTARSSRGSPSPVLETTPHFFGDWFGGDDASMETGSETDLSVRKHAFIKQWAEYTEADGLGDIPSEWNVPTHHSVSPVDSKMELPFDDVMAEISRGMSPMTRDKIQRRAARMKSQHLKSAQSISLTSNWDSQPSRKISGKNTPHTGLVSRNTTVAATDTRSSTGPTAPRYTASAKGKGRDPREHPDIAPVTGVKYEEPSSSSSSTSSDEDSSAEEIRRRQIEADRQLAAAMQRVLDERRAAELAEAKSKAKKDDKTRSLGHKAERNRTSIADKETHKDSLSRKMSSTHKDRSREHVEELTKGDERHEHKPPKHSSKHSSTAKRGGSAPAPPLVRKMALDQVPEKSYLFNALDSDSETTAAAKKRARKSSKTTKTKESRKKDRTPSDSSSSNDSSSSSDTTSDDSSEASDDDSSAPSQASGASSDAKRRRKQRAKKARRKRFQLRKLEYLNSKPDPPSEYDGQPDFRVFQKFALEVKDCVRYGYISQKRAVSWIKKYLGGRASAWYMREVAKDPRKWTLNKLLKALFNHCFPPNFRSIQREKYDRFCQRGHPIRDYRVELTDLRDSIGDDISERQFIIRFWQGADSRVRIHWAEQGYDRESSTMDELEICAANYETALLIAAEEKTFDEERPRANRTTGNNAQRTEGESSNAQATAEQPKKPAQSGQKLTKAEMNEYRAAGKCFDCGSTEHIRKDCPKWNTLKPRSHTIQSSAVTFDEIERRHVLARAVDLGVFCVSIELAEPSPEHEAAVDAIYVRQIRAGLLACLSPKMDMSEVKTRFEIEKAGWYFKIYDRLGDGCVNISQTQLLDPAFDFQVWYETYTRDFDFEIGRRVALSTESRTVSLQDEMYTHIYTAEITTLGLETTSELGNPEREMEGESRAFVGSEALAVSETHGQTEASSLSPTTWHSVRHRVVYFANTRYLLDSGNHSLASVFLLYGQTQAFSSFISDRPSNFLGTRDSILLTSVTPNSALVLLIDLRLRLVESWAQFNADSGRLVMMEDDGRERDWSWYVLFFSYSYLLATFFFFCSWSL